MTTKGTGRYDISCKFRPRREAALGNLGASSLRIFDQEGKQHSETSVLRLYGFSTKKGSSTRKPRCFVFTDVFIFSFPGINSSNGLLGAGSRTTEIKAHLLELKKWL
ncbi:uncharacterized protein EAE98_001182 [Botrytis deweyae]|uniref:Uncharacterized protein n=1 Tax=Botrytis deweyae TaxID=2478750 RepID=A0ABQ7J0R7_9HELO|nr:uncharacterized protein EAE98_001182 [Botrytis deweyae]KAF7938845.1 hypothetical protein EAE98_001182 [Botrytis deweyae]